MGQLFVIATPIGNLSDISKRALDTLKFCDFVAAEDTRVTIKLLNYFKIKKKLISYYEHSNLEKIDYILSKIESGKNCALVSDAGMPAISDPGEKIIKECYKRNIIVTVVPGPSAVIAALAISGLSAGRFTFEGFLSVNKKNRLEHLNNIKTETRTMVFYEAPHKLSSTLIDLFKILGNRKISIIREITKIHEEVIRTNLETAAEKYKKISLKGEIVLVIEGEKKENKIYPLDQGILIAKNFLKTHITISDAAKRASKITGIKKSDIYKELIK